MAKPLKPDTDIAALTGEAMAQIQTWAKLIGRLSEEESESILPSILARIVDLAGATYYSVVDGASIAEMERVVLAGNAREVQS